MLTSGVKEIYIILWLRGIIYIRICIIENSHDEIYI